MALTYYQFPVISCRQLSSRRIVEKSFWIVAVSVSAYYSTMIVFGILEGNAMLNDPASVADIHRYYGPVISVVSTIMGIGFWLYFSNVFLTARQVYKRQ